MVLPDRSALYSTSASASLTRTATTVSVAELVSYMHQRTSNIDNRINVNDAATRLHKVALRMGGADFEHDLVLGRIRDRQRGLKAVRRRRNICKEGNPSVTTARAQPDCCALLVLPVPTHT